MTQKFKVITIDDYGVIIDEQAEIKTDDWCLNKNMDTIYNTSSNIGTQNWSKIIASINKRIDKSIPLIVFKEQSFNNGEVVWIKVFSNWSVGLFIGNDFLKNKYLIRESEQGGSNLYSGNEILKFESNPNNLSGHELQDVLKQFPNHQSVKYNSKQYSEEDLKLFFHIVSNEAGVYLLGEIDEHSFESCISKLNKPAIPTEIELEVNEICCNIEVNGGIESPDCCHKYNYKLKISEQTEEGSIIYVNI